MMNAKKTEFPKRRGRGGPEHPKGVIEEEEKRGLLFPLPLIVGHDVPLSHPRADPLPILIIFVTSEKLAITSRSSR